LICEHNEFLMSHPDASKDHSFWSVPLVGEAAHKASVDGLYSFFRTKYGVAQPLAIVCNIMQDLGEYELRLG